MKKRNPLDEPFEVRWTEMSSGARCVEKRFRFSSSNDAKDYTESLKKIPEVIDFRITQLLDHWEK